MYGERGSLKFLWFVAFFPIISPNAACPGATAWHYRMLGSLGEGSVKLTTVLYFGESYFCISNPSNTDS